MNEYIYKALSPTGTKVNGTITADNFKEARNTLKSRKLIVIDIKEAKKKSSVSLFGIKANSFGKKLKLNEVSHFCKQFSIIISSGVNSVVGLETLAKRSKNKVLKEELNKIISGIKMGTTISEAMLQEGSKFPKLLGAMVSTGEATGTLEEVLKNMSVFYEREYRIRQKVKNASTYPTIVILLTGAMLFIFSSFVMPNMMETVLQTGAELPTITKIVLGFSNFMSSYWYIVLAALIVGFYFLKTYIKTPAGRYQKDLFLNKIPVVSKSLSDLVAMRFSRALYLFTSTGYPMLQGLDYIKENLSNAIAEKAISNAKEGLTKGESLADNIEKANYFDPILVQMISVGEQTGQLEIIIKQMADFYEQEAEIGLNRLVSMIEPILIIVVGIIVATLVISIFLPMLSVYDAI